MLFLGAKFGCRENDGIHQQDQDVCGAIYIENDKQNIPISLKIIIQIPLSVCS